MVAFRLGSPPAEPWSVATCFPAPGGAARPPLVGARAPPAVGLACGLVLPRASASCCWAEEEDARLSARSGGGQEAKKWPNMRLQEKFHRAILEGVRNISDPL